MFVARLLSKLAGLLVSSLSGWFDNLAAVDFSVKQNAYLCAVVQNLAGHNG